MSEKKSKGGRPRTDRNTPVTVKLSDDALAVLSQERNKSEFIDQLIQGKAVRLRCPHCGEVITIKTD